jgi:hypothetical protein
MFDARRGRNCLQWRPRCRGRRPGLTAPTGSETLVMRLEARQGVARYPLLETLRQYALDKLLARDQRVGSGVPAASFRRRRFPGGCRGRDGNGTPMPGEGGVHLADVRVVQAGAHHRGFEIVVADNLWNSLPPDECVLVGAQKPVALLGPQWLYPGSFSRASAFACASFSRSSGASPGSLNRASAFACAIFSRSSGARSRWSNQSSARRLSANG